MFVELYRLCSIMLPIALEGLPVSSSGHVLLCAALLARATSCVPTLPSELDHIVHLPIALMVALFFAPRWVYLLMHLPRLWHIFFKVMGLGFITVLVTALTYGTFQLTGFSWFPLWLGFASTTALLFSLRFIKQEPTHDEHELKNNGNCFAQGQWNVYTAILLGAVQGLALLPGISRLGITYVTARWLGMRAQKAFELSFLIEWPISVAGFLKGLYSMHSSHTTHLISSTDIMLMVIATIIGFVGLWIMQQLVRTHRVWQLGWYMACLTLIALTVCI